MINAKKLKLAQWEAPESQIFFQGHVDFGSVHCAITGAHSQKMWRPFRHFNSHHYREDRGISDTGFLPGIKRKNSQKMKDV